MSSQDTMMEMARQEIQVMDVLKHEPCTREELEQRLRIQPRRLEYVIKLLRDVDFVYRVPGTHLLALRS